MYNIKELPPYYVLIAGSRTICDYNQVSKYIDAELQLFGITPDKYDIIIVQGEANGIDYIAYRYAEEHKYSCYCIPALWHIYGNSAGFIRNEKMHNLIAKNNDNRLCICFKHSLSNGKGTSHSIELGQKYGTDVVWYDVLETDDPNNKMFIRKFYQNRREN